MIMQPTMNLRFVERFIKTTIEPDGIEHGYTIKVLQQQFASITTPDSEWRDVPLEQSK